MFKIYDLQTGEVPTKRKNKAYAVIKNEMEERERAKKRASKNVGLLFILVTIRMRHIMDDYEVVWVSIPPLKCCLVDRLPSS